MDNFLKYFYQDVGRVFGALLDIVARFFNFIIYLFNFPMRLEIIRSYDDRFTTMEWVMLVATEIVLLAVAVILVILVLKLFRKIFRFRVPVKKYDEMVRQVRNLQRDLIRANYEKDKLLQMRVAELGVPQEQLEAQLGGADEEEKEGEPAINSNRNTMRSPCVDPSESRFFRLTTVDNFYKTEYIPPQYDDQITLPQLCERFRMFAASQLHLYYEIDMVRYFIAAMGTSRMIILQGISGTGKTSLPYAFG